MVLDEDALEAMLRRQNNGDAPAAQATLTDETAEFDVYERPQEPEPVAPEPVAPQAPAPQAPPMQEVAPQETEHFQSFEQPPARPQVVPSLSHAPEVPAAPAPAPTVPTPAAPAHGGARIGLVHCRFNHEITDKMVALAQARATEVGATVDVVQVAGVYDAPLAAQRLARRGDIDAVVVIGVVVTGDTDHDQVITQATATNLQRVALDTDKPVGLGVTGPGMSWVEAEARVNNAAHAVDAVVGQIQALA